MRDFLEEKPLLCIETMHGFDQGVAELADVGFKVIYASLPILVEECLRHRTVVGIVKGPRTKIGRQELDLLAHKHPNLVISYIGRHPSQVLAPDIHVVATAREGTVLVVQTRYGNIPVLSLAHSPLSSAVCAYVVTLSQDLLANHDESTWQLSINAGNTFSVRRGHAFTADNLKGSLLAARYNMAVIGAGDIGSQVIQSYVQAGAQVSYNTRQAHLALSERGCFVPSVSSLFRSQSRIDVLTIHVPPGTVIPLEQVQNVRIFINTSSGPCIDDDELIRALAERRIQRALIDVFRHEGADFYGRVDLRSSSLVQSRLNPFPHVLDSARDTERKRLLQHLIDERRLFLTPHIAYLEESAVRQTLAAAIENIVRYQSIHVPLAAC
ncbi:MAG TPA: NAD(P)-dependent oxidoreductase [Ktedonobacteraceae bacterium]|nr:NAD(P)-dependent oxidoreductase [Ktedonobacteraceae bacterium]